MNIIQSKDHRIETYGNNKVSLSTKYIFKTMKKVILIAILKGFFVKHIVLIFSLIKTVFLSRMLSEF